MKRHKYTFPKILKKLNINIELENLAIKFLKNQKILKNSSLFFSLNRELRAIFIPFSKINTYCLITGRVHYTIKPVQISRQVFFEFCREGSIPGFFFSS